jgi:predicted XRE-type DNA-binding protein
MKRKIEFERSTGNVFADIGVANPEEALAKAEIARQVNHIIANQGLTQSEAAKVLGIDQPRVSALSKGRLSVFSLEKMMQFASRLGNEVEISIKPSLHCGIKVSDAAALPGIEQHVLSSTVIDGQNIDLLFFLDQEKYGRQIPMKMDWRDGVSLSGIETPIAA